MHQKLVIEAFKKVRELEKDKSGVPLSDSKTAKELSAILLGKHSTNYSYKSLENVFKGKDVIKKGHIISAVCEFLDFEDYQDFLKSQKEKPAIYDFGNSIEEKDVNIKETLPKQLTTGNNVFILKDTKILVSLITVVLLTGIIFYMPKKQRCMVWKEDHYVEVSCNPNKHEQGQLKFYKEDRVESFKKIKPNCDYQFFDKEGNPKIWYGKNIYGALQLFTSYGLHPETEKTLKPITYYMINKYICK